MGLMSIYEWAQSRVLNLKNNNFLPFVQYSDPHGISDISISEHRRKTILNDSESCKKGTVIAYQLFFSASIGQALAPFLYANFFSG